MWKCAALDVGGPYLHDVDIALAVAEKGVELVSETLHLAAVAKKEQVVGVVVDEAIGGVDGDEECAIVYGARRGTVDSVLSLSAGGEDEEQEEGYCCADFVA